MHAEDAAIWAQDADLLPPQARGLFTERLLGVGGRSAAWLVECRLPGSSNITWAGDNPPSRLALKVPLKSLRSAPPLRSAQRELHAMLPLVHEYMVRPWGLVRTAQGQTGLLLEACTAGSLGQLQRSAGTLSPGECVTALTPVAQALNHLHERGAAHGDVTAANILLTPEGRPALGDLGDTVLLGMDAVYGTSEDDVHALASVTWSCLTGREPDAADRRVPLQSLVPEATDELTELIEVALSPYPTERPLAREFASELYESAPAEPLNLLPAVDDHALTELPTVLPGGRPSRRTDGLWHRLVRRMRRRR
ncbi:protein kinase domain-containing protein [Nesterenkonia natronophila]|nr:protein kinase [Nesterenkonia natronophila]